MYISFTGRSNFEFEIDQDCEGVLFSKLSTTAKIKVERISDNDGDLTIYPELTVNQYAMLFKRVMNNLPLLDWETGAETGFNNFYMPFASNSAIRLNDVSRYKVKVSGHNSAIDVDVYIKGSKSIASKAMNLKRAEVRGTLTEKEESILGTEYLVFPESLPEKVEYRVADTDGLTRKITIDKAELSWGLNKASNMLIDGTVEASNSMPVLNVTGIDNVIVHTKGDGNDFTYYKLDLD